MPTLNSIPEQNHFITLEQAIEMTKRYRDNKDQILLPPYAGSDMLPNSETFDAFSFQTLLNKEGCAGIRIYYGMDTELKIHAVCVAVNAQNEDILPASGMVNTLATTDSPGDILEDSLRCPPLCPPTSPLNE